VARNLNRRPFEYGGVLTKQALDRGVGLCLRCLGVLVGSSYNGGMLFKFALFTFVACVSVRMSPIA
jgi:hypothetical protein